MTTAPRSIGRERDRRESRLRPPGSRAHGVFFRSSVSGGVRSTATSIHFAQNAPGSVCSADSIRLGSIVAASCARCHGPTRGRRFKSVNPACCRLLIKKLSSPRSTNQTAGSSSHSHKWGCGRVRHARSTWPTTMTAGLRSASECTDPTDRWSQARNEGRCTKDVPVSEELREWIGRNIDPAGRPTGTPLFLNVRTGQRWSQWALMDRWKTASESVGVFGVTVSRHQAHNGDGRDPARRARTLRSSLPRSRGRTKYAAIRSALEGSVCRGAPQK